MNARGLKGSLVALVTPFHADGSINFDKLGELLQWHVDNKTDGIVILGTTAEAATMSQDECDAVCRFAVEKVGGKIPLIAGSGSNCTQTMLEKSQRYEKMGVDGLLIISPYYNKSNTEGMYRHFATVADGVNIPCIIYNVPGRTGCSIPVDVVARLAKHKNIAGIKEASGDMSYAAKVARLLSDDFVMYSGNDDIIVPMLALGAVGVISVYANVMPRQCHDIVFDYLEGRHQQALDAQLRYLPLINGLFMEVNPIPVKAAMNLMGMQVGSYRLPLYDMTDAHTEDLRSIMKECGLL